MTVKVEVTDNTQPMPEEEEKRKFYACMMERFEESKEASTDDRQARSGDLKFRAGDQWPDNILADRANDTRPALTINQLPHFIRLVTNDMRQNRAAITISPTDSEATEETARVIQGMVRHIEYDSNADFAYDTAADAQCTCGLGYFRVVTQYETPMSFDQVLKIRRIRNAFSVYHDPSAQEPDFSDAKWMFIVIDMPRAEYEAAYPNSELARSGLWDGIGDQIPGWINKDACRIAEYFYISTKKVKIWLLNDKTVIRDDSMKKGKNGMPIPPEGKVLMGSRDTELPTVNWCKTNGIEKLEETEWLGQWIPIIPVMGDELDVDGKVTYEGIVRHAKDPQRMYNYWASAETETIALAPKAPWIGVEGQFSGHEIRWREANRRNFAYLEYHPVTIGGAPAPPPQRNVQEPPVRAITQARELAGRDMQNTTGTFDPAMGKEGNETSGRAILARQNKHGITNYHYSDNMARSIRHLGRIIVDLIPKIYDNGRVIRIINPDGTSDTVTINETFKDEKGLERMYDVRKGKYDVIVSAGPSYSTKRQESVQTMMQLAMAYPQLVEIAGDLLVKNMDWAGAAEIAERLKKLLPPALQDGSDISPAAQAQIQQMRSLIQQLVGALNKTSAKLEGKVLDIESKERIALNKNLVDLVITAETLHAEASKVSFTTMTDHINQQLDRVGEGQDPEVAARSGSEQLSPTIAAANAALGQDGNPALPNGGQPMQP